MFSVIQLRNIHIRNTIDENEKERREEIEVGPHSGRSQSPCVPPLVAPAGPVDCKSRKALGVS